MKRALLLILLVVVVTASGRAASPQLLEDAVRKWVDDQDRWAYTQRVQLTKGGKVTQERVERYDPSQPHGQQWQLLEISGRPPTAAQLKSWRQKKVRELARRPVKPLEDYFDFERAAVTEENDAIVRYEVPVRPDDEGKYPFEKLAVSMTVRKDRRVLEQLSAGLRDSVRVAVARGLASITDLGVEIRFRIIDENYGPQPELIRANSAVRIAQLFTVNGRAELGWSDFQRVTPYREQLRRDG